MICKFFRLGRYPAAWIIIPLGKLTKGRQHLLGLSPANIVPAILRREDFVGENPLSTPRSIEWLFHPRKEKPDTVRHTWMTPSQAYDQWCICNTRALGLEGFGKIGIFFFGSVFRHFLSITFYGNIGYCLFLFAGMRSEGFSFLRFVFWAS